MKTTFYKNLCIKNLANNISSNEKELLTDWLDKSNQNKLEYKKLEQIWNSTSPNKIEYELNFDKEWSNLKNNISTKTENQITSSNPIINFISSLFPPKLQPIWMMGVAVILVVSSILVFKSYNSTKNLKIITTVNNQRLEVLLPDGSLVRLNSDSEIQFYKDFDEDKRQIRLKGEAFFSVSKDGRPFIISTDNATTTVLGTKFNVWSRYDETRVLVKEGRVSLADNSVLNNKIILTKGELSNVIETQPPADPSKVDADYMLGWLNGSLVFYNTSLWEIVQELERFYDVKVSFEDKELLDFNLTGSFNNEKIDGVLEKICLALNLKYVKKNNDYSITK